MSSASDPDPPPRLLRGDDVIGTEGFLSPSRTPTRSPFGGSSPGRPASRARSRPAWWRWSLPGVLYAATWASTYLIGGAAYAAAVMLILTAHELGHFLQARHYGIPASPPYFVPFPFPPFGTLGAIIAMRAQVADRRSLFDIAITGPLAGLVPTLLFCAIGLSLSRVAWGIPARPPWLLGKPLLFRALELATLGPLQPGQNIEYHPLAIAAWTGLFITALNLIPIGQLDGGHILYALLLRKAHVVSLGLLAMAVTAHFLGYKDWWPLILLLILLGPRHPPTVDDEVPLGRFRVVLGWLVLLFVVVGFTPTPFGMR